ncbi:MAG: hypothetical protein JOZ38_07000 [Candidatus Eremiobacteraeota bacterium]|nr:hypothetical protein [Candidatus Eremiobacteraeota bacterium]
MFTRRILLAFGVLLLATPVSAQEPNVLYPPNPPATQPNMRKYDYCTAVAQQRTGWNGNVNTSASNAPLKGAAGGAIAGSLIGGMGGGNAGRGAAIGAGFGLVAGAARKNSAQEQQQNAERQYYSILNACLAQ